MSAWFLDNELPTCLNFKTALYSSALVMKLLESYFKLKLLLYSQRLALF